jgi:hypothetical protein
MNEMTVEHITELQKGYKVSGTQEGINTGLCWHMEGSVGRFASDCLEAGICMLPEERHRDYYGSTVPSRNDVKPDSKGGLVNAQNFWQKVEDGDFEVIDALEQMFGADVEEEVQ